MKHTLHKPSKEGRLRFEPAAHMRMLDTSNIRFDNTVREGVTSDIEKVFNHVAEHYLNKYRNKRAVKTDTDHQLTLAEMPGVGSKLLFAEISSNLITTTISRDDGFIFINKNFVFVFSILKKLGLDGKKGDIYGSENDWDYVPFEDERSRSDRKVPYMGNLYYAILYSMAIHAIRGYFRIIKNSIVFRPDDEWAQGQRGRSKLYFNLAALLWFYLEVVEDKNGFDAARIKSFISTNRILLSKFIEQLDDEIQSKRIYDLVSLYRAVSRTIKDNGIQINEIPRIPVISKVYDEPKNCVTVNGTPYTPIVKEKPVSESGGDRPTPASVFSMIQKIKKNLTTASICKEFSGADPKTIQSILSFLKKLEIVKDVRMPGGGLITHLQAVSLTSTEMRLVNEILETVNDEDDLEGKIIEKRTELANTMDISWKKRFFHMLEKVNVQKNAMVKAKKIVIVIESSWVPERQRKNIKNLIDSLKESGMCTIVHGDKRTLGKNLVRVFALGKISPANVIVITDESTLKQDELKKMRAKSPEDQKSPFLIGVRGSDLQDNSYVRLMEMLTRGLQLAFNLEAPSAPVGISRSEVVKRTCIFKPKIS